MNIADQVLAIQRSYPQVFHACHTLHLRRRTSRHALSQSDSNVLVHLDARRGTRPGELAAHMGLAPSSLSSTLARLVRLGYVVRSKSARDRRAAELRVTPLGSIALQATSVLDTARLADILGALRPAQRAAAVRGLDLLARGARQVIVGQGSATRWSKGKGGDR